MKTGFTFLFLLSTILSVHAQSKMGLVRYQLDMSASYEMKKDNEGISKEMKALTYAQMKAAENIEFSLYFNGELAEFSKVKKMISEGDKYASFERIAVLSSGSRNYLTDPSKPFQIEKQMFEGRVRYVQRMRPQRTWKLSKESKKIGEFICYKATFIRSVPAGDFEVIAWYAPEIPVSLGPKNYYGELPGLILELHDNISSFRATSVQLHQKEKNQIYWPKASEYIAAEEYQKQSEELNQRLQRQRGE